VPGSRELHHAADDPPPKWDLGSEPKIDVKFLAIFLMYFYSIIGGVYILPVRAVETMIAIVL
jgi:hypothetical protein